MEYDYRILVSSVSLICQDFQGIFIKGLLRSTEAAFYQ